MTGNRSPPIVCYMRLWTRWRPAPLAIDAGVALVLFAVEVTHFVQESEHAGCACSPDSPWAITLLAFTTLPLIWRRRAPFLVANVIGAALIWSVFAEVPTLAFGGVVAIFTVADLSPPRTRAIALAILVLVFATNPFIEGNLESFAQDVVMFAGAWIFGALVRTRRAYTAELESKAERLEREKEAAERLAIAEERSRIAREIHDVVAHGVGIMVVQAGAARSVLRTDPGAAEQALLSVERTGRDCLSDMRGMLQMLRSGSDAPRLPQPGLARLSELVSKVRGAGLEVRVDERGAPVELSPAADLSAYRIIQEALTNVVRHANASLVELSLSWSPERLAIEVCDDGQGAATRDGGQGLAGIEERVAMLGGHVTFDNPRDRGFRVAAELPLTRSDAA
jgi:MYXO-CTERM domain-containing protein